MSLEARGAHYAHLSLTSCTAQALECDPAIPGSLPWGDPPAQSSGEHHGSGWGPNWKLASSLLSPALLSSIVSLKGNSSVFPHSLNASPALGPSSARHPQCLGLRKGCSSTGWVLSFALVSLSGRGGGMDKHPL